jgi:2-polyprenyl-3-methyl-5-hydroxy-6-metoxy-1,4-benzoquinol methylase
VNYFVHDAVNEPLPTGFDVVTCSLFLHHLSEDDARTLFANMQRATNHLLLVNDLSRSRLNYCAVWFACRLLSRSRVVHYDGPVSVRSAFTPQEAVALATQAGLAGAQVQKKFPARFLLSWRRA